MNMLDPFEGEDEVSDQENVPTAPPSAPAPPAQVKQQPEKEEADSKVYSLHLVPTAQCK